ncbi:CYTH domain-containing protein [Microbacterium sp. NEAU-LLC]|uniref:CYTH domain-containing protein n=1 Tax=Microbacterium helvum TaxID=2773713 RepID=A0ABR8NJ43_9MICO|nr:CYTH domain-containing protein [Microbacterium helvum]MBD3940698.1 CYTH domain-containing protein [Microbacterium helvum]
MTDPGPRQTYEFEIKFDVDGDTPFPDWSRVDAIADVQLLEVRDLDAVYFDTPDLDLGQAGHALRRRVGGPDAGWHIKGPLIGGARRELQWPLDHDETIPDAVVAAASEVADPAMLAPIARIRNTRVAFQVRDTEDRVLAEFVDDHVIATDLRSGVERTWREWEYELGPVFPQDVVRMVDQVKEAVSAAGGREAASASKLARALGA